jgi:oxygen-independent coproporphyrinogen-3 oxidase
MDAVSRDDHAVESSEILDGRQARGEFVFLGLRCLSGFAASDFRQRFGGDLETLFPHAIDLRRDGLLRCEPTRWMLTERGLLLADSVFATFL